MFKRITLLAGGVGGAKMAEGLVRLSEDSEITIIGNVADDHEFHGLHVSPDIDTLIYSLANIVDREQGWGRAGDTHHVLGRLAELGAEAWMLLGDLDFATHIRRTEMLRNGQRMTEVVAALARIQGVQTSVLPATDDPVRTRVHTDKGWLAFQEYFVRDRCRPTVREIAFAGAERARATPEALAALAEAELILIAPSNPVVSIAPMLAVPGFADAMRDSAAKKFAIAPFIEGRTVKGPADRMMTALGYRADPVGLAEYYVDLVDGLVVDRADGTWTRELLERGLPIVEDDILMRDAQDKKRLAGSILTSIQAAVGGDHHAD